MTKLTKDDAIKLLKEENVNEFNRKREEDSDNPLDLANSVLSRVNLSNINLTNIDLRRAALQGVSFHKAKIINSSLGGANLFRADLSNITIEKSYMDSTHFREADLYRAIISDSFMEGASFFKANLCEALFLNTNLYRADLTEAYMFRTDFTSSKNLPLSEKEAFSHGAYVTEKSGINMVKIKRPVLSSSVSVDKEEIHAGDEQTINVKVADKNNPYAIIHAKITGEMKYGTTDQIILEEGYTDDKNQISYSWTVPLDSKNEGYMVRIQIHSNEYENTITTWTKFRVING